MTLEEAIEISQSECCVPNSVFMTDKYQALALLIEAGKEVKRLRALRPSSLYTLLPGETEE